MSTPTLADLKQKLLTGTVFADVWKRFLTHFGERPDFHALGEGAANDFLHGVTTQVVAQLAPAGGGVHDWKLVHLPADHFYHAGFFVGTRPCGVIYFEDVETGLVVVTAVPPSIEVKYARFKGRPVRTLPQPSNN